MFIRLATEVNHLWLLFGQLLGRDWDSFWWQHLVTLLPRGNQSKSFDGNTKIVLPITSVTVFVIRE